MSDVATAPAAPAPAAPPPAAPIAQTAAQAKPLPKPAPTGGGAPRTPVTEKSAGAFKVHRMNDPMRSPFIKVLIYGAHGSGKTTLAGSAADVTGDMVKDPRSEMDDVFVLSFEGGNMSLLDNDRILLLENIDEAPVQTLEQLQKVHEFLKRHCLARDKNDLPEMRRLQAAVFQITIPPELKEAKDRDNWLAEEIPEPRRYRTAVIDSLTEIEAVNLAKAMGLDNPIESLGNIDVADWPVFRKNQHGVMRIVRSIRNLPMHVIFICGVKYTQDEMKKMHYTPDLTGKLATMVQGAVDIVGYLVRSQALAAEMERKPEEALPCRLYVQSVNAGPKFDAKCRRASFKKPYFDDPTMLSIMQGLGLAKAG